MCILLCGRAGGWEAQVVMGLDGLLRGGLAHNFDDFAPEKGTTNYRGMVIPGFLIGTVEDSPKPVFHFL